ncbi:Oxidoreductase BOA1 [Colletotrichum siamense]|nr:Oxidoreductase BOA1 [Colletotrichum siamense]
MVKVAIAGGSSSIGKAIFDAIGKLGVDDAIILGRKTTGDSKVVVVDYTSIQSLTEVLDTHEVHTVISTVSIADDASGMTQMNLIEAAVACQHTKRFMPSEFGAKYDDEFIRDIPTYEWKFKAVDRLKETDLEYTQFSNGMFMDYWLAPRIESAFRLNLPCWVDLDNHIAAIPGDGNRPIVLTHSRDIGRFVAAVLGLPRWERRYYLVGDRLTVNDFVAIAEETSGVKFEKKYDKLDVLREGNCTPLPAWEEKIPSAYKSTVLQQVALSGAQGPSGPTATPKLKPEDLAWDPAWIPDRPGRGFYRIPDRNLARHHGGWGDSEEKRLKTEEAPAQERAPGFAEGNSEVAENDAAKPSIAFPHPTMSIPPPSVEFGFRVAIQLANVSVHTAVPDNAKEVELFRVSSGSWSGSFGSGFVVAGGYYIDEASNGAPGVSKVGGLLKLWTNDVKPAEFELRISGSLSGPADVLKSLQNSPKKDVDSRKYSCRMSVHVTTGDERYAETLGAGLWVASGAWSKGEFIIDAYRVV